MLKRGSWLGGIIGVTALALAFTGQGTAQARVTLALTSPHPIVAPGDSFYVQGEILSADSSFNAFDLIVHYDPAMVTFVQAVPLASQMGSLMTGACGTQFHLFNAYSDSAVTDVSLLCSQTFVTGPGTIYKLKFRAKTTLGSAAFQVGASTRFYRAGIIVSDVFTQGVTIRIGDPLVAPGPGAREGSYLLEAPRPNPVRGAEPAVVEYSLPAPARVRIEVFDLQGRRATALDVGDSPAGRSLVRWGVPGLAAGRYELRLVADGRVVGRRAWVVLR